MCLGTASHIIEEACEGRYPSHWKDGVHEEDGGWKDRGIRPQHGIELLKGEPGALIFRNGIATATDDVSDKELVPTLVQSARDEEIAYFVKRGVYKVGDLCQSEMHIIPLKLSNFEKLS